MTRPEVGRSAGSAVDILLFNPPRYRSGRHHKFNNALLWLASYLHERGVGVRIVPLSTGRYEETVRHELATYRPRFVAVSCKWWDTLYSSTHIAALVKQLDPGITVIAGGHTASFFAQDIVRNTAVDVVVRGDGEEPLFRLVTGQEPTNLVFAHDRALTPVRTQYVQTEHELKSLCLTERLEDILSDMSVLNGYVWTGKGCTETCVYCAANAWNNVNSFGRARFIYRPIDTVVRELEILSTHPSFSRVMFDFDPLRGNVQETYHLDLLVALPKKRYSCYFCSWSLPSPQIVDALAETFHFVEWCIDVQTASQRLREELGARRFLKPSFSDDALEEILARCARHDNMMVDLSTLMGLPFERDDDVACITSFGDRLYDTYENIRYPYVSPMNVEPGSLLLRDPARYEMTLMRRTFDDFLRYTRRSFEHDINCYQPEVYEEGVFHPLGVAPTDDVRCGRPLRVYERWKEIQEHIDRRSSERILARTKKYKHYGLLKAGIHGGIDRPTLARAQAE